MTFAIAPQEWVACIEREYLESFVKEGGSAVKVAAALDNDALTGLERTLTETAKSHGYLVIGVDAVDTRVHMVDEVFFRIAEQIPWQQLARWVVLRLAVEDGYKQPDDVLRGPLVAQLAEANELGSDFLGSELRRKIAMQVFERRDLSKDFRVAMTQLCLGELFGGPQGETTIQALTDWLSGKNKAVSAVKQYQIFNRITRTNARYLFESLLRWVRFAGARGVVMVVNIARVSVARNPYDGLRYYSKAMVLDAYEVLRQFIDGTDRLDGCLIVVVAAREFLDDDPGGRGIGSYQALKFRVFDEIRDRQIVNPMASMVRLAPASSGGYE
jgi:hypothetical protein